eukprot:gb/GECG01008728.1/.p1 GENE.gb/GECG01008728.1/~~gb/GECG01008728.1/.p1  ORF type:complete len:173 (+),score=4.26 gb/GECG01008728.1/:1-519(+)
MLARSILERVTEHGRGWSLCHPRPQTNPRRLEWCRLSRKPQHGLNEGSWRIRCHVRKHGKTLSSNMRICSESMVPVISAGSQDITRQGVCRRVADRGASVRIPCLPRKRVVDMEDKRPASNIDPYIVTANLFQTTPSNKMPIGEARYSTSALQENQVIAFQQARFYFQLVDL